MNTETIVQSIDAEIARLEEIRALLSGIATTTEQTSVAATEPRKRKMSKASRERIAEAQRKRWRKVRKEAKVKAAKRKTKPVKKKAKAKKPSKTQSSPAQAQASPTIVITGEAA